jgi:hypothetical protein
MGETDLPITKELLKDRSGYTFSSGQTYMMHLGFFHSRFVHGTDIQEPVRGTQILTTIDKTYFAFTPQPIEINFRYDTRSVEFVSTPLNQDSFSSVYIRSEAPERAKNEQDSSRPAVRAPELDLVLKLTYPRLKIYIAFFFLFFAQVLALFGANLLTILDPQPLPSAPTSPASASSITVTLQVPSGVIVVSPPTEALTTSTSSPAQPVVVSAQLPAQASTPSPDREKVAQFGPWLWTETDIRRIGFGLSLLGSAITTGTLFFLLRRTPGG